MVLGECGCTGRSLQNAASPWTGVKGVRLAWAFHDATQLFVVTPKGVRMTPIYFDDQRGNPMGCPPIWSREHLDRLRVESGWLIATIDGTGPTDYDQATQVQTTMYQRGLAMCRMAGKEFHCLELNPQYDPSLATKTYRSAGGRAQRPDGCRTNPQWWMRTQFLVRNAMRARTSSCRPQQCGG
jgi:hypothetical protein